METGKKREFWLSGPVEGIPALLQPVAHALLQAREEVKTLMMDFPEPFLWVRPSGRASAGFHLEHLTGVLDRLFTYARDEALSKKQFEYLAREGKEFMATTDMNGMLELFSKQVDKAIAQLANTDENTLTEKRGVGREQIPSTVIGLLTHAAEHTMRHVGQLLVTVSVLKS